MTSVQEIDERLAAEELTDLKPEEEPYADACKATLTDEQKKMVTDLDIIQVVRGYETYEPRMEETVKAFKEIIEWREKVNYPMYLQERLDKDELFYKSWPEHIYGEDKYGHPLISMRISEMDTDKLHDIEEQHMLRLQGQKQTLYTKYKRDRSKELGTRRYKYSLVIDMKGGGMSVLSGKKRGIIKQIMSVGADHFPESIWKIYVVNTPMIFRAIYGVVRPWIHPITQAKVSIIGSAKDALKIMREHGFKEESIPDFLGGKCEPRNTFDYLKSVIEENQAGGGGSSSGGAADGDDAGDDAGAASDAKPASGSGDVDPATQRVGHLAVV